MCMVDPRLHSLSVPPSKEIYKYQYEHYLSAYSYDYINIDWFYVYQSIKQCCIHFTPRLPFCGSTYIYSVYVQVEMLAGPLDGRQKATSQSTSTHFFINRFSEYFPINQNTLLCKQVFRIFPNQPVHTSL